MASMPFERHSLPAYLSALRHPNFRLWFFGQSVSLIGTWMQSLALQWVVYDLTGSKFLLGAITFANSVPNLFLMLPAGVLADRFPRKHIIFVTQTAMMLLAFLLAALMGFQVLQVWHLFLVAALLGVANSMDAPARQAFTVDMVEDRQDVTNAIALNSTIFNMARVIGPAIAGWVLAIWGPVWCFALNGASFIAVLGSLLLMRFPDQRKDGTHTTTVRPADGLRYVIQHPVIFPLILQVAVSTLFAASYMALLPAYAVEVLGVQEEGFGLLMAAVGVGALAAAVTFAVLSHRGRIGALFRLGCLLFPASLLAFSFSQSFPVSLGLLTLTGFGFVAQNAATNTIIQHSVSDALRGRVMSVFLLAFFGSMPFGALLVGILAQVFSPVAALSTFSAITLVSAVGLLLFKAEVRRI